MPAVVLDRRCGSAQTASEMAASLIASGVHDLVIAAGVEHMGHVPMSSPAKISELYGEPWTARMWEQYDFVPQGESAELIAECWDLPREELDGEIRRSDQTVPPGTTVETLAGLKTVFRTENGRTTAGTSSPICDGAAGVLLASQRALRK